jgi:hypothetical protein
MIKEGICKAEETVHGRNPLSLSIMELKAALLAAFIAPSCNGRWGILKPMTDVECRFDLTHIPGIKKFTSSLSCL